MRGKIALLALFVAAVGWPSFDHAHAATIQSYDHASPVQGSGHEPSMLITVGDHAYAEVGSVPIAGATKNVELAFELIHLTTYDPVVGKWRVRGEVSASTDPVTEVNLDWTSKGKAVKLRFVRGKNEKHKAFQTRVRTETALMEELFKPDEGG